MLTPSEGIKEGVKRGGHLAISYKKSKFPQHKRGAQTRCLICAHFPRSHPAQGLSALLYSEGQVFIHPLQQR